MTERSISMGRAVLLQDVGRMALVVSSVSALPPTDPTFVRGPRGGVYLAIGPWERIVTDEERWDRSLLTVIDRSTSVRYVRPGSRFLREWQVPRTAHYLRSGLRAGAGDAA